MLSRVTSPSGELGGSGGWVGQEPQPGGLGEPMNLVLVLVYPHLPVLKPTEQIPFVLEHPFHPAALSWPLPDHSCG